MRGQGTAGAAAATGQQRARYTMSNSSYMIQKRVYTLHKISMAAEEVSLWRRCTETVDDMFRKTTQQTVFDCSHSWRGYVHCTVLDVHEYAEPVPQVRTYLKLPTPHSARKHSVQKGQITLQQTRLHTTNAKVRQQFVVVQ